MGWWGSVKNAAEKTKLRGDIALTQRHITARKKKFGEEFYDVLTNDKQKSFGGIGVSVGTLSVFKKSENDDPMTIAFETCRGDIRCMQVRKEEHNKQLDVMEVKGCHTMPDETIGQNIRKTGRMFSDAGVGTKVRAQMALIDREMKIRKENFGLEVYDFAKTSDDKEKKGGFKGTISKALSGLSEQEKEIQKTIDVAKKDVKGIEGRVISLERQIAFLDSEMEPLAPTSS
jgi:hypothetical protein